MARTCTVCAHPRRQHIDALLIEGEPMPLLAARFDLSRHALHRHHSAHIASELIHRRAAAGRGEVASLFLQVYMVQAKTLTILDNALNANDRRTALAAIREARRNMELLSRLRVRSWDCARHEELAERPESIGDAADREADGPPASEAPVAAESPVKQHPDGHAKGQEEVEGEWSVPPDLDECLVIAALTQCGDPWRVRGIAGPRRE